jgi:inosose dehydratase
VTAASDRIAGAPITWGVCEVTGWGRRLEVDRVLGEMRRIGLRATEFGPDGFLPSDPALLRDLLTRYGLAPVGGFIALTLHREDVLEGQLARAVRIAGFLAAAGADMLVLAAATWESGYEDSAELDDAEWKRLLDGIDRVAEIGAERGLMVALHPHQGTVVEGPKQVLRLLESSSVPLCIDTGHLLIGGADPVEITRAARGRVVHVHLKDVAEDLAAQVREGGLRYHEAVRRGLYRPLGAGDVDVAEIVRTVENSGYNGWYVLEQDAVLETVPGAGEGPIRDAAKSLDFIREVTKEVHSGAKG